MRRITALRAGRRQRVNLFLDGKFALRLEAEVAIREHLHVNQMLSTAQIEALAKSNNNQRCYNAAVRYLSYRPRSESELSERLRQHGFAGDSVEAVIARLKEQGLVDDMAFARFWRDNRESFSPRSQWLIIAEMKGKGIADDIIKQVVEAIDDNDNAYRAALGKARNLTHADYQSFRRRLGGYLKRRGFSYGVIAHTIEQIWQEQESKGLV